MLGKGGWRISVLNQVFPTDIPALGESAEYTRGHQLRHFAVNSPFYRKGGGRSRMGRKDWACLLALMAGTRGGAQRLGFVDFAKSQATVWWVNASAKAARVEVTRCCFDEYDLSAALCLRHSCKYHLGQGTPFVSRYAGRLPLIYVDHLITRLRTKTFAVALSQLPQLLAGAQQRQRLLVLKQPASRRKTVCPVCNKEIAYTKRSHHIRSMQRRLAHRFVRGYAHFS